MRQTRDGESRGVGLFFDDENQRGPAPVRPFHQQRDVQLAEALAQAFLELFLAYRGDAHIRRDCTRFGLGAEGQGLARIVEH